MSNESKLTVGDIVAFDAGYNNSTAHALYGIGGYYIRDPESNELFTVVSVINVRHKVRDGYLVDEGRGVHLMSETGELFDAYEDHLLVVSPSSQDCES